MRVELNPWPQWHAESALCVAVGAGYDAIHVKGGYQHSCRAGKTSTNASSGYATTQLMLAGPSHLRVAGVTERALCPPRTRTSLTNAVGCRLNTLLHMPAVRPLTRAKLLARHRRGRDEERCRNHCWPHDVAWRGNGGSCRPCLMPGLPLYCTWGVIASARAFRCAASALLGPISAPGSDTLDRIDPDVDCSQRALTVLQICLAPGWPHQQGAGPSC
jgi:hypothetical protein